MLFKRKIRERLITQDTSFYNQDNMEQESHDRDAETKGIRKLLADEIFHAKKSDVATCKNCFS